MQRPVILMTPRGRQLTDDVVRELAQTPAITLLCGRYEGFDERVHTLLASDAICIGPYVLAGGEIPAMAVVDAVGRRLPGALGNRESLDHESFSPALGGGTEYPHYTRPADLPGRGGARGLALGRPRGHCALACGSSGSGAWRRGVTSASVVIG